MRIREIRITEPFRAEVSESELDPIPGDGNALIRTEFSGISSGTELAVFTGKHQWLTDPNYPSWRFPFRSGYSACGVVEAVGSGVTGLEPGTRVAYAGNHTSRAIRPARSCWRVPEGVRPEFAAFTCIVRYGFGAAARVPTTMGRSVVVQGLGVIGQSAVRAFAASGAYPVIGVDPFANRRETALLGGADAVLDPGDNFPVALREANGGELPDIVADATGVPAGVVSAMGMTREGGQCVIVGSPRGTVPEMNFYPDMHKRCIEVLGAHGDFLFGPIGARLGWNVDRAMRWILEQTASGRLRDAGIPTECAAPSEAIDVYDRLLNGKDTIVSAAFDWSRG